MASAAPSGTSWTYKVRDSGSFGSEKRQVANESVGEETWQRRKYHGLEIAEGTRLSNPVAGETPWTHIFLFARQ